MKTHAIFIEMLVFKIIVWSAMVAMVRAGYGLGSGQWQIGGSTQQHGTSFVLTPGDVRSPAARGSLWHDEPFRTAEWELVVSFSIAGKGMQGGEGFAVMVSSKRAGLGSVFGSDTSVKGLAVVFDTHDDDGMRNNPSVAAHMLDGTTPFSMADDGIQHQLAGCVADFRNRPSTVKAKITYSNKKLAVFLDLRGKGTYQKCMSVNDVTFETDVAYLGFSAETRTIPDTHEISGVALTLLDPEPDRQIRASSTTPPAMPLEVTEALAHEKLDYLLQSQQKAVDANQLGEALDEIEYNLVRQMASKFAAVTQIVQRMAEQQEQTSQRMRVLTSSELPKLSLALTDIARAVADLESKLDTVQPDAPVAALESRMRRLVRDETSRSELRLLASFPRFPTALFLAVAVLQCCSIAFIMTRFKNKSKLL